MKTKSAAVAWAGLIAAISVFICACASSEVGPSTYEQDGVDIEATAGVPENPDITDPADDPISEVDVPAAPVPEKTTQFDDPDSYIIYDSSTDTYYLTEEEEQIGKESLFVGDSICLGFSTWSVVPDRNVYATGNVGARNLFEYEMYYLSERAEFTDVLNEVKPKHIFLWMGMNDVNLTSAKDYCENYRTIIDTALQNTSADVYICAITPICRLDFTGPMRIREFNEAIERFIKKNYTERVHFINFGEPLKNADGILDEQYNGGDGIHLARKAYYVAMHEINRQMIH